LFRDDQLYSKGGSEQGINDILRTPEGTRGFGTGQHGRNLGKIRKKIDAIRRKKVLRKDLKKGGEN